MVRHDEGKIAPTVSTRWGIHGTLPLKLGTMNKLGDRGMIPDFVASRIS
jgi:hypothetical protein